MDDMKVNTKCLWDYIKEQTKWQSRSFILIDDTGHIVTDSKEKEHPLQKWLWLSIQFINICQV